MDHGGLEELYGGANRWDPHLKRPVSEYLEEAVEKGWQVRPSSVKPRIFFEAGGNILRRTRGYDRLYTVCSRSSTSSSPSTGA